MSRPKKNPPQASAITKLKHKLYTKLPWTMLRSLSSQRSSSSLVIFTLFLHRSKISLVLPTSNFDFVFLYHGMYGPDQVSLAIILSITLYSVRNPKESSRIRTTYPTRIAWSAMVVRWRALRPRKSLIQDWQPYLAPWIAAKLLPNWAFYAYWPPKWCRWLLS